MNYLIDTHILLWYLVGNTRVDSSLQRIIESDRNTIFISNASMWEIAIKISIGKLKLSVSLTELKDFLFLKGFKILEFDFDDLETLVRLPFHHQDPFDRLIAAQGLTKKMEVITDDENLKKYL